MNSGKPPSFIGPRYQISMQNVGSILLVYYAVFVSINECFTRALLGNGNMSMVYTKSGLCIQASSLTMIGYFQLNHFLDVDKYILSILYSTPEIKFHVDTAVSIKYLMSDLKMLL